MVFRPLKDDQELDKLIEKLSRTSEQCALFTAAVNRAATDGISSQRHDRALKAANKQRQTAKQDIRRLVNTRIAGAYGAGVEDGIHQQERKRQE